MLKAIEPQVFGQLAETHTYKFEALQNFELDLVQPLSNLLFNVLVVAPREGELHQTFIVKVTVTSLKKNQPCLVQMSDRNLENMLIVNKNSVLCNFDKFATTTSVIDFEILPLKTGCLKVPDIMILPVIGGKNDFDSSHSLVEVRNAFVKVITHQEVQCIHTNNLFNDKVQEV